MLPSVCNPELSIVAVSCILLHFYCFASSRALSSADDIHVNIECCDKNSMQSFIQNFLLEVVGGREFLS